MIRIYKLQGIFLPGLTLSFDIHFSSKNFIEG